MKALVILSFAVIVFDSCKKSSDNEPQQQTVTLQPGANDGNDAYIITLASDPTWADGNTNSNPNTFREISAVAWTNGGSVVKTRSVLSFNLSSIPAGSNIISAKLSLYGVASSNVSPQGNSGDNKMLLQRIVDNWSESTVTWNNQPGTSTDGQIELAATT